MTEETKAPALSERIPSAGEVVAALTLWWGEPPRLDGDIENRREMSDAIRAAEFIREAEAKATSAEGKA